MDAQIISIGNELLIGDTVNTNASWLGDYLTGVGFDVKEVHTIPDDQQIITHYLDYAIHNADLVICTGGLGPTHDDITKKAVADYFEVGYKLDEEVLNFIKDIFQKRNIPFTDSNRQQAEVPENSEVLFNTQGTAPGMWFDTGKASLAVLPGVPYEMKYLIRNRIAPKLREKFGSIGYRYSRYIKTAGIGESTLSDKIIGDLSDYMTNGISMAYLPAPGGVVLRVNAHADTEEDARELTAEIADEIYKRAGDYIYGEGKDTELARELGVILKKKGLMLAVAESCTGGLVSNSITDIPGSSDYMAGGVVSYSNKAKSDLLDVKIESLQQYGAVSKEVALQMAKGVAEKMHADIGLSTTGVAGPGGGTEEKPVGTVWIGFWSREEHFAIKARLTNDRLLNKERSKMVVLETCRRTLLGMEELPYDLKKQLP
ncbi:competence/damage-inducible protein A [Balneola sp. MJW-20]|uniref:competence/damage-inducible protein A n=1 Tax=Gracilimonas aurantiaca TaxID=3234185 RepID=UPI00346518F0